MPNHRTRQSRVIRGLIWVAAVALAVVIVWALLVPGTYWLARHDIGSANGSLATARDAARGRLLTLGAGLLAAGALLFTARNFTLSREGQVTDRYTKAIEQLGSDKLDVRIGGIYALERIARDSAKDHTTVMEVLTAFIREHSREQWPPSDAGSPEQERLTRPDVQAAVTVAGRRDAKRDILPIDLAGADLTRAHLIRAHLTGARLTGATLTGANLHSATLTGAWLVGAHLTDAHLIRARLTGATLTGANLTRANLHSATLVPGRSR
jgi:Pentapeptide repeats (8 copies)